MNTLHFILEGLYGTGWNFAVSAVQLAVLLIAIGFPCWACSRRDAIHKDKAVKVMLGCGRIALAVGFLTLGVGIEAIGARLATGTEPDWNVVYLTLCPGLSHVIAGGIVYLIMNVGIVLLSMLARNEEGR